MRKLLNLFLVGFLIGIAIAFIWEAKGVSACKKECKHENAECEINNSEKECCEGLTCVPFNEASGNGKCEKIEVTPTPTNTPTPTPTDEPKPTPTEEPTPIITQDRQHGPASAPPLPVCEDPIYAPTVLGFDRPSPTSVKIWWSKIDEGVDDFVVWFGLEKDNLTWNDVVKDSFETTLNELPADKHIWVGVQGDDDGCIGPMGEIIDP